MIASATPDQVDQGKCRGLLIRYTRADTGLAEPWVGAIDFDDEEGWQLRFVIADTEQGTELASRLIGIAGDTVPTRKATKDISEEIRGGTSDLTAAKMLVKAINDARRKAQA